MYRGLIDTQKNLTELLKAFSLFVKCQKSGLQLLTATGVENKIDFAENLRLFKYREDVKVLEHLSRLELAKISAAAYAIIYVFIAEASYMPLIEAMKCNVPLITSKIYGIPEIC